MVTLQFPLPHLTTYLFHTFWPIACRRHRPKLSWTLMLEYEMKQAEQSLLFLHTHTHTVCKHFLMHNDRNPIFCIIMHALQSRSYMAHRVSSVILTLLRKDNCTRTENATHEIASACMMTYTGLPYVL